MCLLILDDGSLYTCGENDSGKLGLDESQLRDTSELQKLFINERVTAVACGGNHTAVVTARGKLFTFGQGDHGQLGHGTSTLECTSPKQVASLGNVHVKFVACGESHTAIITKHGNLYTCGDGRHGKLGMREESFSNLFRLEKVKRLMVLLFKRLHVVDVIHLLLHIKHLRSLMVQTVRLKLKRICFQPQFLLPEAFRMLWTAHRVPGVGLLPHFLQEVRRGTSADKEI